MAGDICHSQVFFHRSASGGRFPWLIFLQNPGHQLGIIHDDATSCILCYPTTHAGKELRLCIAFGQIAGIGVKEIGGHLNDGTEFNCPGRGNVMAHTRSTRTNGPTLFVPIYINKYNRGIEPFLNKELTKSSYLLLRQRLLGMGIGTNGTIDIIPKIGCTLSSHALNVLTAHQFVVVILANAGCNAKDKSCPPASTDAAECALIDFVSLAATVTLLFQSLDTDKRRNIASLAEPEAGLLSKQRSIGEELEIAVVMPLENADESLVHQGFPSQYAKELGAVTLTLADDTVYLLHRQALPSSLAYPAAAASQITGLGDGNHIEGREERFAPLLSSLEPPHIPQIGPAEIPAELPQQPDRGLAEHPPADFHQ